MTEPLIFRDVYASFYEEVKCMQYVYIIFDNWETYNDVEDRLVSSNDLIDVFSSREKAVDFIKKEIIEKHGMMIIDDRLDLKTHGDVYVNNPKDEEIHCYYIVKHLVK